MRKRSWSALALSSATAGLVVLAAAPAAAAEPTNRQLLEQCNNGTDTCVFHPDGPPQYYTGPARQVGDSVYNCTNGVQRFNVSWSDTTSQSNSVGIAMTTEAGFGEAFAVSYEQSYEHTWKTSHTESQTTYVDTGPYQVGWVERQPRMERVSGTYEMHFGDPYYGHYIWYVPFEARGPASDGASEAIVQHNRDMTDAEKAACP
ncbi:hypothetical protein [Salinactinospora qingdaonensis]|uniref:Peptidase inhibitor family I36 n=1 Tax=Salinactinospora qingdaonensis TaxID=702744 RepID=A0ABP7EWR5_9ACTN